MLNQEVKGVRDQGALTKTVLNQEPVINLIDQEKPTLCHKQVGMAWFFIGLKPQVIRFTAEPISKASPLQPKPQHRPPTTQALVDQIRAPLDEPLAILRPAVYCQ